MVIRVIIKSGRSGVNRMFFEDEILRRVFLHMAVLLVIVLEGHSNRRKGREILCLRG